MERQEILDWRFVLHKPQRAREIRTIEKIVMDIEYNSVPEETAEPLKELVFRLEKGNHKTQIRTLDAILKLGLHHNFGTFMTPNGEVTIAPKDFLVEDGEPMNLGQELEALKEGFNTPFNTPGVKK